MVGRNLTDSTGFGLSGHIPALEGLPRHNADGIGGMHLYIPWWELDKKNKDFPRGYHVELGGGFGMPGVGSFHGREGWEGASYLEMARQVADGHFPVTEAAPEVFRLGGPALAGLVHRCTGFDLLVCFKLVNGTANALILGLLVAWLRHFLGDWRVRTALCLVFLLQWDAPVRWMYFFPPHTDPWMWVFVLAGLIAVERCREQSTPARIAAVTVLTVAGVCFREIVLIIALVLPFTSNPIRAGDLRERWREARPIRSGCWQPR